MKVVRTLLPLMAILALGACGEAVDDTNGDGGTNGDNNNNNNNNDREKGLTINAALGVSVYDFALSTHSAVDVLLTVELDGNDPPAGTTVTLNGTPLVSWLGSATIFTVDSANVPTAAPGQTIQIVASYGGKTATLNLPCPADPNWSTTPAPGSAVAEGSTVTASWTGNVYYDHILFDTTLTIVGYDEEENIASLATSDEQRSEPVSPAKSASVKAPAPQAGSSSSPSSGTRSSIASTTWGGV